jgi:predicted aspartyl protease
MKTLKFNSLLYLIIVLVSNISAKSQPLAPQDVVDYLNKISYENPIKTKYDGKTSYYVFKLDTLYNTLILNFKQKPTLKGDKGCNIDLNDFYFEYKNYEGKIDCSKVMYFLDNDCKIGLRDYADIRKRYCYMLYPCELENIFQIYADAINYLVSILKNRKEKKQFENPFNNSVLYKRDIKIKLDKSGALFYLNAIIYDNLIPFVFDSGASDCSINEVTYKQILDQNSEAFIQLDDALYKMADGNIRKQKRYILKEIDISGQILKDIIVSISPKGSPNLIGQSFLSRFTNWSFNQKDNILILKF